jgi:glycosyltransferase involved in cell wall biosynthesis
VKVAFVNQPWNRVEIPVRSGSIAIWTYEVARRLTPVFEPVVYARSAGDDKPEERREGVEYRRVSIAGDVLAQRIARRLPLGLLRRPLRFDQSAYFRRYASRIAKDARRENCDVIHIHNYSQFAPVCRRHNPRSRIVLHMHCEWLTQIDRRLVAERMRSVDRVVGCSEYLTGTIRRAFPDLADRCRTVRNGVNIQHFSPAPAAGGAAQKEDRTVLFVGRMSPEKGVHVLLDAFRGVVEAMPNTRLELVGPLGAAPAEFIVGATDDPMVRALGPLFGGDYLTSLKKMITSDLSAKVSFVGPLPYLDLLNRYRASDVFVFPSVWNEPFGLPVVEAMACGKAVVATKSGGITEVVRDGDTGLLVDRGDAKALSEALLGLLRDERLSSKMGESGARRAREMFAWERVADDLGSVYAETPASRSDEDRGR